MSRLAERTRALGRHGGWSPTHPPGKRLAVRHAPELARLPAFAGCTARELKRIARWGDLIEVGPGQVLVRRDHSDWWFFVVVSGRVDLRQRSGTVGELVAGSHFGETAILGLRPQQVTATATEPTIVFALGPRYVLSLLSSSARFRRAMFADVAPADYPAFAKQMYDVGQVEWRRISPLHPPALPTAAPRPAAVAPRGLLDVAGPTIGAQRDRLPGRPLSLAEAVQALGQLPPPPPVVAPQPVRLRRRWWVALAAAVVGAGCGVLFLYHPPRLVLTAGRPIDVVGDIRVTGAATYPPSGHYLMLWVNARQPTLAGYLTALVSGRTTVPYRDGDAKAQRELGRGQYLDSQRTAIVLALKAAGEDPRKVSVHIRDRGFTGPSAGLVYALALTDLLTPGDATAGRVVGVTGALRSDGAVEPVGWLPLKARAADERHVALLVVPTGQVAGLTASAPSACGVASLREAMQALADAGSDRRCVSLP